MPSAGLGPPADVRRGVHGAGSTGLRGPPHHTAQSGVYGQNAGHDRSPRAAVDWWSAWDSDSRDRDPAFGVDSSTRVARFTEGIRLLKALWTESQVTFEGRFFQLHAAAQEPKPLQKPHPPVWFGGSHPDALRRAVRYGDGFIGAGSTSSARFADQVGLLRQFLDEAERDPATFR